MKYIIHRLKWFLWFAWHPCGWTDRETFYFDLRTAWMLSGMVLS